MNKYILMMVDSCNLVYITSGDKEQIIKNKMLLESSSSKRFIAEEIRETDDIIKLREDTEYLTERFREHIQ